MKAPNHVVEQIKKLHAKWYGLKESITRKLASNLANQATFQEGRDNPFDITHQDAMQLMKRTVNSWRIDGRKGRGA